MLSSRHCCRTVGKIKGTFVTQAQLAGLRLVTTDVDGVLTDGGLYYGEQCEVIKRFNVRDGLGVRLLQQIGVTVAVVSGRGSGALNRWLAVREITAEVGTTAEQTIFLGDDLIHMLGFGACGLSAAVADAPTYVRDAAGLVLNAAGGQGAFRELADLIPLAKRHEDVFRAGGIFEPADGGSRK